MSVGARVARLRAERGETLRQAASRIGVHHSTLARIESGETSSSFHRTLQRIARGYSVSLEHLLKGDAPVEHFDEWLRTLPWQELMELSMHPTKRAAAALRFLLKEYPERFSLELISEQSGVSKEKLAALVLDSRPWFHVGNDGGEGGSDLLRLCSALATAAGLSREWLLPDLRQSKGERPWDRAVSELGGALFGRGQDPT